MSTGISISFNESGKYSVIGNNTSTIRDNKGKSLISLPENYVVIDLETTGLDPLYCEIIEVAAMKIKNGEVVARYESLVKPKETISDFITQLTGITNEMVENSPTIKNILPQYLDFIGEDIVVGHNINFDINFIYDNCVRELNKPFINNFVDTLRFSRKLFGYILRNHKLKSIAKHFKIQLPNHRALGDCETVNYFYNIINEHIEENKIDLKVLFSPRLHRSDSSASKITTNNTVFDIDHPIYEKYFVFTGTLQKMVRSKAQQIVVDLGGYCTNGVTSKTNYLVLGNLDYCSANLDDGKSSKLKKAESLILNGQALEIISENVFFDIVNN